MDTQSIFQGKIGEISNALKNQFANLNLSEDELKAAMKSPDDLMNYVCEKTGVSKEEATQKVHSVMSSLHIDDDTAKSWMAKFSDKVESRYDAFKDKFSHH